MQKWVDDQVSRGNMLKFSKCLGSWRPDFLVDYDEAGKETYRITEINARFCFNGFLHEAYGQKALNDSVHQGSGLIGAAHPEKARYNSPHSVFYTFSYTDMMLVLGGTVWSFRPQVSPTSSERRRTRDRYPHVH